MNKKEDLPHVVLYDCQDLLHEIKEKYPEVLNEGLSELKRIIKQEELYTKVKNGEPIYSKETADYWLKQLTGYEDE